MDSKTSQAQICEDSKVKSMCVSIASLTKVGECSSLQLDMSNADMKSVSNVPPAP